VPRGDWKHRGQEFTAPSQAAETGAGARGFGWAQWRAGIHSGRDPDPNQAGEGTVWEWGGGASPESK